MSFAAPLSPSSPAFPAAGSQTSWGVPFGKCSVSRSTAAPASRSAVTTERLSSDSSRKKVTGSGGLEVELAADGVPDRLLACPVVLRQNWNRITGLELLRKHGCRDARAGNNRPTAGGARGD